MAITSSPRTLEITTEERTWRATIDTPKGGPYTLTIHREWRDYDADGNQVGEAKLLPPIELDASDIGAETVTVGGVTLTVGEIEAFISAYFDQKSRASSGA
jgi:hypothetical protein